MNTNTKGFRYLLIMLNLAVLLTACSLKNSTINPTAAASVVEPTTSSQGVLATQEPVAQQPPTPWPESTLPVLGNSDSLPTEGCVVYQNGQVVDEDLPYVYAQPNETAAVIGQLGRNLWAMGLQTQNGWVEIVLGSEVTGWVRETAVGNNGHCAAESQTPELPFIMNRGAPANDRCVVMVANLQAPDVNVNVYAALGK